MELSFWAYALVFMAFTLLLAVFAVLGRRMVADQARLVETLSTAKLALESVAAHRLHLALKADSTQSEISGGPSKEDTDEDLEDDLVG